MQKMIDDIRQEALEEARKIRKDFSKHKKKILSEAEAKVEALKKELTEKGKKLADLEKVKIISQANLQAKRERLKSLEELCSQVLEKSLKDLDSIAEEKKYKEFLNKTVNEALKEIPGKAVVKVSSKDKDLLNVPNSVSVESGAKIKGGAVIESKDGNVRIDSTLDSRLMQLWPEKKGEVIQFLLSD
ncbi:MAG TPA: V-type ATP synthase subunit E [archaeon]|nr:V-type ATP synthase subunit E [archaeon]